MEILMFIGALVALDILANLYGADSREARAALERELRTRGRGRG